MSKKLASVNRKKALSFLLYKTLFALAVSLPIAVLWSVSIAQSFMVGVMLDVLPSLVFTLYAFRFSGGQQLKMVAASFYRGETVKIMLTGAMFIAVIKFLPVIFPALFVGFLIAKLAQLMQSNFFL